MKKKKVLIVIGDVAGGHRSAAKALSQIFEEKYADKFEVKTIDLFTTADVAPFNSSEASYAVVSQNHTLEAINNFIFRVLNTELIYPLMRAYVNWRLFDVSRKIILNENPDIVISNHPFVCMVVSRIKQVSNGFKSAVVITDLVTLLRGWADPYATITFAPTKQAEKTLVEYGVDASKVSAALFPINPNLKVTQDKAALLESLGLDPLAKTILVTGGGVGTKIMLKGLDKLVENQKLQFIILAGKLPGYLEELERRYKIYKNVKVLGFVNNFPDFLNASEIVIAKPGPATILEIELFNKKAVITRKVGEQELGNIDYALQNPLFRYIGDDWDKLPETVNELLLLDANEHESNRRKFNEAEQIVDSIAELV